ncbi:MAG: EamA family transporter, partial [Dehalococcoidia bacterium]|nr:EamA family transporter [Dehalococcoidia bacterium]
MTTAVGLSALAALFWVVSGILASKVTEKVDAVFLSFVSLMPAAAVLFLGTLVIGQGTSFGTIGWERLLFLGLAGLSNYVLARTFFYI